MSLNLKVRPSGIPLGIQQRILAGSDFNGELPAPAGLVFSHGLNKFQPDVKGGLFHFEQEHPVYVLQYLFDFGSPVDYSIQLVTLGVPDEAMLLEKARAQRVVVASQRVLVGPDQALQVVTQGGAAAMLGRVYAVSARRWS